MFTTRRRSSGCRASHWSMRTTFGGSPCKKLSRVSRYWGDPVV